MAVVLCTHPSQPPLRASAQRGPIFHQEVLHGTWDIPAHQIIPVLHHSFPGIPTPVCPGASPLQRPALPI